MAFGDWSTTAANNTTVGSVNIGENCPPGNLNNGIREVMAQLRAAFSTSLATFFASPDLATARANLGAVSKAGDTLTGNLTRQGAGAHPYFADANLSSPVIYVTAAGASNPTGNQPGAIWIELA